MKTMSMCVHVTLIILNTLSKQFLSPNKSGLYYYSLTLQLAVLKVLPPLDS